MKPRPRWLVPIDDGSDPATLEVRETIVPPCVFLDFAMRSRVLTPREACQLGLALLDASRDAGAAATRKPRRKR